MTKFPAFCWFFGFRPYRAVQVKPRWNEGCDDYHGNNWQHVLVSVRDGLSKEVPRQRHSHAPRQPSKQVVEKELVVLHVGDSRDYWRERPDNWDKARQRNSFPAVFFVKLPRPLQVLFFEEPRVLFLKQSFPVLFPEPVADVVSCDGGDEENQ